MKKIVEFFAKVFFAVFFMGVLVSVCGVGEFCAPLMFIGMGMVCVGFVLSIICFVAWDSMDRAMPTNYNDYEVYRDLGELAEVEFEEFLAEL